MCGEHILNGVETFYDRQPQNTVQHGEQTALAKDCKYRGRGRGAVEGLQACGTNYKGKWQFERVECENSGSKLSYT